MVPLRQSSGCRTDLQGIKGGRSVVLCLNAQPGDCAVMAAFLTLLALPAPVSPYLLAVFALALSVSHQDTSHLHHTLC